MGLLWIHDDFPVGNSTINLPCCLPGFSHGFSQIADNGIHCWSNPCQSSIIQSLNCRWTILFFTFQLYPHYSWSRLPFFRGMTPCIEYGIVDHGIAKDCFQLFPYLDWIHPLYSICQLWYHYFFPIIWLYSNYCQRLLYFAASFSGSFTLVIFGEISMTFWSFHNLLWYTPFRVDLPPN